MRRTRRRDSGRDPPRTERRYPLASLLHASAACPANMCPLRALADNSRMPRITSLRHGSLPVMMDTLLLLALNGLVWGLIIALIALGLSVIFGLLDIINIAHGDFFMVGTVLAWASLEVTGNFWVAFVIVPLICLVLGALIQVVVIQPIRGVAALSIV